MEAAQFRLQPTIHAALQQASVIRIGAIVLQGTGVTLVRWSAVMCDLALEIRFFPVQMVPGRTLPNIELSFVNKAYVPKPFGSMMRMPRCALQNRRHRGQEQCVTICEQDFQMN